MTPGLLVSTVFAFSTIVVYLVAHWKKPQSLLDPIPFIFNTIQFIFYNAHFQARIK
jgi:hypothetical protein